jgi:hypothetical protein
VRKNEEKTGKNKGLKGFWVDQLGDITILLSEEKLINCLPFISIIV